MSETKTATISKEKSNGGQGKQYNDDRVNQRDKGKRLKDRKLCPEKDISKFKILNVEWFQVMK